MSESTSHAVGERKRSRETDDGDIDDGGGSSPKRVRPSTVAPSESAGHRASESMMDTIEDKQMGPPQWARIAQDHMQAMTEFITIHELGRMSRVCSDWRRMVGKVPNRSDRTYCGYAQLLNLLQSPSRRHITHLAVRNLTGVTGHLEWDELSVLSPFELAMIRQCMPRLYWIGCAVDVTHQPHAMERQFPQVEELSIRMMIPPLAPNVAASWSHVRRWLVDIGRITTLTSLTMRFHSDVRDGANLRVSPSNMPVGTLDVLSPLYDQLTTLGTFWNDRSIASTEWSTTQITALRRFNKLNKLHMGNRSWSAREIADLFAEPSTMPLTYLELSQTVITEGMTHSLGRATNFTKFEPMKLNLPDASFLSSYRQLEECRLICTAAVNVDLLVATLSQCTLINKIELGHPAMSNQKLELLLTPLTKVTSLGLVDMDSLTQLSFLSRVPHLAAALESFRLTGCRKIPVADFIHLLSIPSLTSLQLWYSFSQPLDPVWISLLTRDSPLFQLITRYTGVTFTNIKEFSYIKP